LKSTGDHLHKPPITWICPYTSDQLESVGLTSETLSAIRSAYCSRIDSLKTQAETIVRLLQELPSVHSIKYRIKDPNHLIEKIVRKKTQEPDREINLENYADQVTDLIGVRALHLYKQDWVHVHDYITGTWALRAGEQPTAYIREGDEASQFDDRCAVKTHDRGYRSVHYVIEFQPTKEILRAEIQVRSLFEEAWSEIDHQLAYPNHSSDPVLLQCLLIFNSIVGYADQMASFMRYLQENLNFRAEQAATEIEKREAILGEMSAKLDAMVNTNIQDSKDKAALQEIVGALKTELAVAQKIATSTPVSPVRHGGRNALAEMLMHADKPFGLSATNFGGLAAGQSAADFLKHQSALEQANKTVGLPGISLGLSDFVSQRSAFEQAKQAAVLLATSPGLFDFLRQRSVVEQATQAGGLLSTSRGLMDVVSQQSSLEQAKKQTPALNATLGLSDFAKKR